MTAHAHRKFVVAADASARTETSAVGPRRKDAHELTLTQVNRLVEARLRRGEVTTSMDDAPSVVAVPRHFTA